MTSSQQWAANKLFLDQSIAMGHEFIMSNSANAAKAGTMFYREVQYLLSNGYRIVDQGMRMIR